MVGSCVLGYMSGSQDGAFRALIHVLKVKTTMATADFDVVVDQLQRH